MRPLADRQGERGDLVVAQVALCGLDPLRQCEALRRVGGETCVVDGELQGAGEHVDDHANCLGGAGDSRGPLLRLQASELSDLDRSEPRTDVGVDYAYCPRAARGPEVRAGGDPDIHPVADGDAGLRRVDVGPAALVELDAGQEQFGVALGAEAALGGLEVVGPAIEHR